MGLAVVCVNNRSDNGYANQNKKAGKDLEVVTKYGLFHLYFKL